MRWTPGVILSLTLAASGCMRGGLEFSGPSGPVTLELRVRDNGRVVDPTLGIDCTGDCTYELPRNAVAHLTASHESYEFGKWEGACAGTAPTCELQLSTSYAVGARFGFRLVVEPGPSGEGSVRSDLAGIDCGTECIGVYNPGTTVTLTATVTAGTSFRGWQEPECTTSAPCAIKLDDHRTVRPVFFGGSPLWSMAWGGTDGSNGPGSDDVGYAVAVASNGDVVIGGAYRNSVDFGDGPRDSVGGSDQFVNRVDADGTFAEVIVGGLTDDDAILGLALDGDSLYAGGYVTDEVFGDRDATVDRVSPANDAWSSTVATAGDDFAIGLLPTASGTVTVSGKTNGRALVADFATADGGAGGTRTVGGGNDTAWWVARDGSGEQVVVGEFDGQLTVISGNTMFATGVDAFIARYDDTGTPVFARQLSGPGTDVAYSAVAVGDDLVVVGTFAGTVDFGGQNRTANGGNDAFVARYDATGNLVWVTTFGGSVDEEAYAVAATPDGGVVITGYYESNDLDFGYGPLPFGGVTDIFVVELDAAGRHAWSYGYGGSGGDLAYGVAVGGDGMPVVAGAFEDTIGVGGRTHTSAGGTDILLIRCGR